jgi:hypothetical protein
LSISRTNPHGGKLAAQAVAATEPLEPISSVKKRKGRPGLGLFWFAQPPREAADAYRQANFAYKAAIPIHVADDPDLRVARRNWISLLSATMSPSGISNPNKGVG